MLSCNIGNYLIKRQSERYIIMKNIADGVPSISDFLGYRKNPIMFFQERKK